MKVALIQCPIVWGDIDTNLKQTEERLRLVAGQADVALLPEMFTTGFCTDHPELAEEADGQTMQQLLRWAKEMNLAIAGSYMAREGERLYNRGFFVRPNGQTDIADKRHLYASGGESTFFSPGQKRVISEYMGVKFCLLVCYDLRFPCWSRNLSGQDYDILLYTANWPDIRIKAWDLLLPCRGAENQAFVCGVNRVGDDGIGLHYCGHSAAYDTRLNELAHFEEDEDGYRIVEFDIKKLSYYRDILPLWKDTDKVEIL